MDEHSRRDLLGLPLAAGTLAVTPQSQAQGTGKTRKVIDEFDTANIKLAHRVSIRATDEDLLFLKQIGLRYIRAEIPLDANRAPVGLGLDGFRHPHACSGVQGPRSVGYALMLGNERDEP